MARFVKAIVIAEPENAEIHQNYIKKDSHLSDNQVSSVLIAILGSRK